MYWKLRLEIEVCGAYIEVRQDLSALDPDCAGQEFPHCPAARLPSSPLTPVDRLITVYSILAVDPHC